MCQPGPAVRRSMGAPGRRRLSSCGRAGHRPRACERARATPHGRMLPSAAAGLHAVLVGVQCLAWLSSYHVLVAPPFRLRSRCLHGRRGPPNACAWCNGMVLLAQCVGGVACVHTPCSLLTRLLVGAHIAPLPCRKRTRGPRGTCACAAAHAHARRAVSRSVSVSHRAGASGMMITVSVPSSQAARAAIRVVARRGAAPRCSAHAFQGGGGVLRVACCCAIPVCWLRCVSARRSSLWRPDKMVAAAAGSGGACQGLERAASCTLPSQHCAPRMRSAMHRGVHFKQGGATLAP